MKRVLVCSPFRGDVKQNVVIARDACRQVLREGDAPLAPHLLYPSLLDDSVPAERDLGIRAGLVWLAVADEVLVIGEPSEGMRQEIAAAETLGVPVRRIDAAEPSPVAQRASLGDALRCRLFSIWADWGTLLALVTVVVVFLLCPGCVAGARRENVAPIAPAGGT